MTTNNQKEYQLSKEEHLVNSILSETALIIKNKYNLKPCGSGAAMPEGIIGEITLCFDTMLPYNEDELRELLVKTANELLSKVDGNIEIHPFLKDQPFTIKNVGIIIYNHDKNGFEVFDPGISVARISEGKLIYRTTDKNDTFKYKNVYQESYESAIKILSSSNYNQK